MKNLLALALLLLPVPSAFSAADELKTLTDADLAKLASQAARSLHRCKELKKGADVEVKLTNGTEQFFDRDVFAKKIHDALAPAGRGPGRKYELRVRLREAVKESGDVYEATYTLLAEVAQADEVLCTRTETLVKKGQAGKAPAK